jgi:CheY-like chemotaxis protein
VTVGNALLVILVVEDEFLLQEMVQHALADGGFDAEYVASGEKAIALLEGHASRYRALITDIHLKGPLTGWDVAKRARELNPDIPVVYMTGAAAEEWTSHGVPNSLILNKPFAAAQIVTAVSQLLNAGGPLGQIEDRLS